ncbi:MAG TPA: glycosyltransferase [Cytophagales bacterium]|nr:glycosyltransferase [Cytophagales bacterium]
MTLSILIISYNCAGYIEKCLQSILQSGIQGGFEIIVVDNNSTDGTRDVLQRYTHVARIIYCDYNFGYSKAMNLAYRHSKGELILTFNPDAELTGDKINSAIKYLQDHDQVGMLAPYLIEDSGDIHLPKIELPRFGWPSLVGLFVNIYPKVKHPQSRPVKWLIGTGHLVKRILLTSNAIYPETTFLFWEEYYLCKQVKTQGKSIVLHKDYSILHHKSVSFKFNMEKTTWVQKMIIPFGFHVRAKEFGYISETLSSLYRCVDAFLLFLVLLVLKYLLSKDKAILRSTALINAKLYWQAIFMSFGNSVNIHKAAMVYFNSGQEPQYPIEAHSHTLDVS